MKKKDKDIQKEKLALAAKKDPISKVELDYIKELDTNPKYSLKVNPENKYNMTMLDKEFVTNYIQFKNVNTVAEIMKIGQDVANQIFVSYPVQCEIRRINNAMYHRQFATRLLNVEEIGGFLTSLLIDNYVPLADQLKPKEKLQVIDLILKVNEMKAKSITDPGELMNKDLNEQLKNLSVETLQQLISQNSDKKRKTSIINDLDKDANFSIEEKAYLETLSTQELLKLVDDTNKHKGGK